VGDGQSPLSYGYHRGVARSRHHLSDDLGRLSLRGPDSKHAWGGHRWHREDVNLFPTAFESYEDVPRLFREHILPGHMPEKPVLSERDTVVTLGSCFAQELREVLELAGFGSGSFWIPAGLNNTYAVLDFVSWAVTGGATERGFRYERGPDGQIAEWSPTEERAAYEQHFRTAGAFVFTLGLAEVWVDRETDRVFWRGVPEEIYDAGRHEFRLTTVGENEQNIRRIVELIREVNPAAPIVLTLSPVSLLATFRDVSCITADCVSKSVLRVALDNVVTEKPDNVYYWPSFELVKWAGSVFDWRVYGEDARHVHRYLVQCIIDAFVEAFYGPEAAALLLGRLRASGHEYKAPDRLRTDLRRSARKVGRLPARLRRLPSRNGQYLRWLPGTKA
jgi:GSCFA family